MSQQFHLDMPDTGATRGNGVYGKEQVDRVLTKAYARVAEAWKLSNTDAAEMISVRPPVWMQIKKKERWKGLIEEDCLLRIRIAISLYESLHLNFGDDMADRWVTLPNEGPMFSGQKPLKVMLEGGLSAMMETRDYVDALLDGS